MAIQTVQAIINGQTVNLTLNATTGKYEATVTAPSASSHPQSGHYFPVQVRATDTASNVTTVDDTHATLGSSLRLFVKEQIKPTIVFLAPTSGAHIINATPTITFKLLDNGSQASGFSGIDTSTCVVKINGTAVSGATFSPITGGYEGSLTPSTAIPDGTCTVTVDVDDFDGNHADTASITFTIDTVAPTLTLSSPTDGLETNQSTVDVVGATSDATSTPVTISITNNGTDQGAVTVGANGEFSKTITLAQQSTNTIVVTATDAAGKTTSVTRTVVHNAVGPKIKSVAITPNPVNAGQTYTITVEVE